ncbi:MAG: PmoA family protein [Bryobacteraceae bacterium]|nr:PmoA family protein [Bryobacteraceae bacterium]
MIRKAETGFLLFVLAALPASAQMRLEWRELEGQRIEVLEDGRPALVYNYGPQLPPGVPEDRRRCCYVYPLFTPGGVSMLDDFPKDHYHHHGLFWGWPVVETAGRRYDLWMYRGIEHRFEGWIRRDPVEGRLRLMAENGWHAGGQRLVREIVEIQVHPSAGSTRRVDFAFEWEALREPVTLRGSQEEGKSYGGFSARFAPREGTVIRTSEGVASKDEDLNPHRWAELEASYQGRRAVLRITPADSNPGVPYQWCLRHYGFVGASFPGKTASSNGFTLEPGRPLRLRFTVEASDVR